MPTAVIINVITARDRGIKIFWNRAVTEYSYLYTIVANVTEV